MNIELLKIFIVGFDQTVSKMYADIINSNSYKAIIP